MRQTPPLFYFITFLLLLLPLALLSFLFWSSFSFLFVFFLFFPSIFSYLLVGSPFSFLIFLFSFFAFLLAFFSPTIFLLGGNARTRLGQGILHHFSRVTLGFVGDLTEADHPASHSKLSQPILPLLGDMIITPSIFAPTTPPL